MLILLTIKLLELISLAVTADVMDIRLSGRLDGSVYRTLSSIGEIMCGKECVVREKCLSVNYERLSLTCQLSTNADKTGLTNDITWIYIEKNDLSELYGNDTCTKACPPNTMCLDMTSRNSECVITECIDPPGVPYASVYLKKVGVSEETVYTCNTYYYLTGLGNGRLTCKADGTFTDVNFACELKPCTSPGSVPNADVTSYNLPVGSNAQYSCHYGYYVANGPASVTCQLGGTWSAVQFSCNEIPCSTPSSVNHASMSNYQTSVGSEVTYSCNYGYSLSGTNSRTCQLGGSWSAVSFSCNEIPCSSPPSVSHASLSSHGTSVGSRAYYDCNFGYGTSADKSVVCQLGGSWSGVSFECKLLGLFG